MSYRFFTNSRARNIGTAIVGVASICGAIGYFFGAMMPASAIDVSAVATPEQSAVVSIAPSATASAAQSGSLVVNIVGFDPPPKGGVQAVVTVKTGATGETHEIGRFGLFPNSRFKVKDGDGAQKFQLTLNPAAALLVQQQGKVSIELLPYGGNGDGARLEIGGIDIKAK